MDDFVLGIADHDGVVDDGRLWWYIGAVIWPSLHLEPAKSGRAAVAAFRRAVVDAERSKGESVRSARVYVAAAGLYVAGGPLTTSQAYEHEVGWAWAWTACRWSADIPLGPATQAEVRPYVDAETAERIRADVRRRFLQRTR